MSTRHIPYGHTFRLNGAEYRVCAVSSYDYDEIQVKGPHVYIAVLHVAEDGRWVVGREELLSTWVKSTLDDLETYVNELEERAG